MTFAPRLYARDVSQLHIDQAADDVRFEVRVAPRASRETFVGAHDGALKVALTAPPVDGAANDALIRLLAKALAVPRRAVHIVKGQHSRTKTVRVEGIGPAAVVALISDGIDGD